MFCSQSSQINLRGKERLRYSKESKVAENKACANYAQKKQKSREQREKNNEERAV